MIGLGQVPMLAPAASVTEPDVITGPGVVAFSMLPVCAFRYAVVDEVTVLFSVIPPEPVSVRLYEVPAALL